MQTFITICGWLAVLSICIAAAAAVVAFAADQCRRAFERYESAVVLKCRHALGQDLVSCSHWFSESTETWTAIKILGERIRDGYGTDVSRWREEWHERLRASQGKGANDG